MLISYQFNQNEGANMKNRKTYHTCVAMIAVLLIAILPVQSAVGADRIVTGDSPVLKRIIDNGVIRVGINPPFKPFSFTNEKKERVGSRMDMYIRTLADKSGKLQYLIQLRDSYISGIETLEEAISIAEEVIEENKLFIE